MKKTLVFYRGRAPKGEKTNWIMHEYRLEGAASPLRYTKDEANKAEWVVCRIFQKKIGGTKLYLKDIIQDNLSNISEGVLSLSPLNESANQTAVEGDTDSIIQGDHVSSFSEDIDRLPFPSKGLQSYALGWDNRGQSVKNLDSASKSCGSNTSSCLDKHNRNLQVDNASSSSNALLKLMKPPAQQGLDQPYSATCKIKHHADGSDNFQNGYCRLLDKSAWLQESMPYNDSQSLLDAKLPSVSPMMESFSEEIPPSIYRADVVSSTEDFDCLLAC
ncbi:hypothetical protein O6H91_08G075800 [Diphasiastrum complanatum]|nr:hypothetical protein O6H91_08G075800 [Diphasiastrum complanatum]